MMCEGSENLRREIACLRAENQTLRRRLELHENPHVPPSVQNQSPGRVRLRLLKRPEERRRPGRKPGHPGVTRAPLVPDRVVDWPLHECPRCRGKNLIPASTEERDQIELPPPPPAVVTRYRIPHYTCGDCGLECSAPLPGGPIQSGYGPGLKAEAVHMRTEKRLPIRKIQQELSRRGAPMSTATVLALLAAAGHALDGTYEEIRDRIRRARVVYVDETSLRVDGKKWWLWVFTTQGDILLVLRPSRGADVVDEVLGHDFPGRILVCDGWKAYPHPGRLLQRCWAHLLRVTKEAAATSRAARRLHEALRRLYHRLTKALAGNPGRRARERLRRSAQRELTRLHNLYRGSRRRELQKVATYLGNGMPHWLTFVTHPGVEPTNNRGERALRESVVIRKIIGTLRNRKGADIYERLMSTTATWKLQGEDVYTKLLSVLQ